MACKRKELPPQAERKPDTKENGSKLELFIKAQTDREKKLYPLRIDSRTVIYVSKKKCNPEYAKEYRLRSNRVPDLKGQALGKI